MIRWLQNFLILLLASHGAIAHGAGNESAERWVFEGLITECDPGLAPNLQSGWVLAGSFLFEPIGMEEESAEPELRSGRLTGGISAAEMTVDLYYQVLFEATQGDGLAGLDYQDDKPDEGGRDLLGWFFPLEGGLKDSGWTSTWLQVWLTDPEGKMIPHLPLQVSPYGIDWKASWFRITFENKKGETVYADGRLDLFTPVSQVEDSGGDQWYKATSELSRLLIERDATIDGLQKELNEVSLRLNGLRRMVDLLVDERSSLGEEIILLREQAKLADPQVGVRLVEMTAQQSLMEAELATLSGENATLQQSLAESLKEKERLQARLDELEQAPEPESLPEPVVDAGPGPVADPSRVQVGEVLMVEKPVQYEDLYGGTLNPPPTGLEEPSIQETTPSGEESHWSRRKGPRKFR